MVSGQIKAGAVILAAGLSTRFGGQPKALANFGGRPLLKAAVESFQLCGLTQITVVTGHAHHEVAALANNLGAKPVFNRDYQQGMFSSVRTGVQAMDGLEAFFILPVDAALVQPHTILSLLTAWRALGRGRTTASILVPVYQGRTGHPPLIGGRHLKSIVGWSGSGGLRGWLTSLLPREMGQKFMNDQAEIRPPLKAARSDQVANLSPYSVTTAGPVAFWEGLDEGLLCDLDTPAELASARPPLGRDRPTPAEAGQLPLQLSLNQLKIRHCRLVAGGALRLSQGLMAAGLEIDPEMAFMAGLLHDAQHGQNKHAQAGRLMCEALGWPKLALAVGAHTDPPPTVLSFLGDSIARDDQSYGEEDEVYRNISPSTAHTALSVYLADKYWRDDRPVNLAERFQATRDYLRRSPRADQPEALKSIDRRERVAVAVEDWFRTILGADPAETAHRGGTNEREKPLARLTWTTS